MLGLALALLAEVVAEGEAGLAGGFEAGTQRGEAGRYVVLGESEEGGLGGEVCGLDVLGDLVEGLADAGVGGPHCVGSEGYASSWAWWRSSCDQFAGIVWHRRGTVRLFCLALVRLRELMLRFGSGAEPAGFAESVSPKLSKSRSARLGTDSHNLYNAEPITLLSTSGSSQRKSKRNVLL